MKKNDNRFSSLDVMRIAAILAVVLLHTITGIKDTTDMSPYPAQMKAFLLILDLITWCVPVFILISGFLFLNPERNFTYNEIIWKYSRRIVLALIVFGVPYACIELCVNEGRFRIGMLPEAFKMICTGQSWSHMWYLYLVLFLYMITIPLKKLLNILPGWSIYLFLTFLFVFGSITPFIRKWFDGDFSFALSDQAIYIFYYLAGYLFCTRGAIPTEDSYTTKKPLFPKKRFSFLCIITIITLLCTAAARLTALGDGQLPYNYPFTVVTALLLFYTILCLEPVLKKNASTLKKYGDLSFTIYLIHPVFLNIAYKYLKLNLLDYPLAVSIPLFFAAALILSAVAAMLLKKIPILSKYVL